MTRISDALRAAADRAPIGDVHVETTAVAGRVRRQRALRTGSTSLVGAGAVAVIAFGIIGANGSLPTAANADSDMRDEAAGGATGEDGAAVAPSEPEYIAANMCGTEYVSVEDSAVTLRATLQESLDREPTDPALYDVQATTDSDQSLTAARPYVFTVWNGIVVGDPLPVTDDLLAWDDTSVPLDSVAAGAAVNCWDGEALPAGEYEHIIVQVFFDEPAVEEPPTEPAPMEEPTEPTTEPDPALVDPNTSVSNDGDMGSGSGDDAGTATIDAPLSYTATVSMPFTIAGDVPKDPFADYLGGDDPKPGPEPVVPDGAITPDAARSAYKDAVTSDAWDMAAGTQRVVMTASGPGADENEWNRTYFGCPVEGGTGSFPAESANLRWLDVAVDMPSRISVSYGWVVDGNPQVTSRVTNVSGWDLPNAYAFGQAQLVLVKDGRVVAEAYPTPIDRNGGGVVLPADATMSLIAPDYGYGYLGQGEQVTGEFIWRDVNGCWDGSGQLDVSAGTYTVLTRQEIYVGTEQMIVFDDGAEALRDGGAAGTFESGSGGGEGMSPEELAASSSGVDVAPAPGQEYDFASFQVWTSLGTVTVGR